MRAERAHTTKAEAICRRCYRCVVGGRASRGWAFQTLASGMIMSGVVFGVPDVQYIGVMNLSYVLKNMAEAVWSRLLSWGFIPSRNYAFILLLHKHFEALLERSRGDLRRASLHAYQSPLNECMFWWMEF